jgi:DNA-binding CsgD family transcriptional regulator
MDAAPLLEREAQLAALDRALAAASGGAGATVLIRGAPGIGKTRLAAELRRRAEAEGMTTLYARGGELERDFAFGCVRQLFEPVLDDELLSGAAHLAGTVFEPDAAASADPTYGVLHGLYWLTANLAEAAPLVLLLDDAHWADPASLRYAAFLARRLEGVPAVLALTVRPADAGADPLHAIALDPATVVVDLAPLSPGAVTDAVAARLGDEAGGRLGAACHRATAGNPFLLGELLRELEHDVPQGPDAIERLAPDRVRAAVLARLQRAGEAAPALARAVAVLGDGVSLGRAAELAELAVDAAGPIADALGDADILDTGRPLRFAHPIVRNAILDGTPAAEQERLHRRAATLLAEAGAPAEAQAAHLLAVEPAGREDIVDVLRAAASRAGRRGAPETALRYLERALAEPPPAAVRADLLAELGFAAGLQGDPRALDWLRGAVDAGRGSAAAVESAAAFCSAVAFAGGADEAFAVADRVLLAARRAGTSRDRLASARLGLAQISPATRRLVREAVRENLVAALAGADLPPAMLANAATECATAGGTMEEAAALARRAIERGVVGEVGRDEPGPALTLGALIIAERLDEAERLAAELIVVARARGTLRYYAAAVALRAWARYRSGRLADVRADADLYPDLPKPAVTDLMIAGAHIQALVDVGELGEASAVADRILAEPIDRTLTVYQRFAEGLALLRIAQDDHRGALDVARGVAAWETGTGQDGGTWVAWRCHAAVAHAALGEDDAAVALAEEQVALARRFGAPGHLGSALRVLGVVGGDVEVLREGCEALERSALPLERARALVDLGRELHRAGRGEEAREHLREGLARAQRSGAAAVAARALDALVATGARPRRPAAAIADALTPSERRVAQLAADGMTNKEIAQALFVTVNTVETHLRRAYRKLGINSRAQLGDRLGPSA